MPQSLCARARAAVLHCATACCRRAAQPQAAPPPRSRLSARQPLLASTPGRRSPAAAAQLPYTLPRRVCPAKPVACLQGTDFYFVAFRREVVLSVEEMEQGMVGGWGQWHKFKGAQVPGLLNAGDIGISLSYGQMLVTICSVCLHL